MKLAILIVILTVVCCLAKQQQSYIQLRNGRIIPMVGFGTWELTGQQCYSAVRTALQLGYRHFDTAPVYMNEREVGRAIRDEIRSSNGTLTREHIFVTTKVWNSFHSYDNTLRSVYFSLGNMTLAYIDLVLIHWPFAFKDSDELILEPKDGAKGLADTDYMETWRALEEAVQMGLVRSIGLSNFNYKQSKRVNELAARNTKPVVNQVESHPNMVQTQLLSASQNMSIAIMAWRQFGGAKLFENPTLKSIAAAHNKTTAQVMLRYQLDRQVMVIPKSANPKRMKENIEVFDFRLTPGQVESINKLNTGQRLYNASYAVNHKYYPFRDPY